MKKQEAISPPAVGGSSLLVIFAVLCLTVFALLSVTTVQAERRMADASVQAVEDYYRADLEAEGIFARLRSGETVPGVEAQGGIFFYQVPISEYQTLYVTLKAEDNTWTVLGWQSKAHPPEMEDTLDLWDGKESLAVQ